MNDRFKFRFWDKVNNFMVRSLDELSDEEWKYAFGLYGAKDWWYCVELGLTTVLDYFDYRNFIIMQCVGLKDKNNKIIYEGDIIRFKYFNNNKYKYGIIKYKEEDGIFCINYINDKNKVDWDYISRYNLEVVGNIYNDEEKVNIYNLKEVL